MPADATPATRRLLIVQVAGLGLETARAAPELQAALGGPACNPLLPPIPAVTWPTMASGVPSPFTSPAPATLTPKKLFGPVMMASAAAALRAAVSVAAP